MNILETIVEEIVKHSKDTLPFEACGYLAQKDGLISKYYALTNTDQAADHFSMDPKEQFAAIKDMRATGFSLCAVYHSHPETPARPSVEDISLAFDPEVSYVIISLLGGESSVKSFRINKGVVDPEDIQIISGLGLEKS